MTGQGIARLDGLADSHCHLGAGVFDGDRAEAIARARAAGVETMVIVGLDPESSAFALELAGDDPGLRATAGLHPHEAGRFDESLQASIESLCRNHRCSGVGETGLDWFKDWAPRDLQQASFAWHLELARTVHKPVVIHSRDAHADTLVAVRAKAGVEGVMHCFSYGPSEMESYLECGLHISFSGNVTYPSADSIREAARRCPRERLLVETDAPYLAPHPHRRERCEPSHVRLTLLQIAEVRGEDPVELAQVVGDNARRLFA